MPKVIPVPEGAAERLRLELKKTRTKAQYMRVLCVWLRFGQGMPGREIAKVLDWNESAVRRIHADYLHGGEAVLQRAGRGGRRNEYLSRRAELAFLKRLLEKTRHNAVVDIGDIQEAYEKRVGHPVSDTAVYRLLKRHGWRRKAQGEALVPRWEAARLS